MRREVTTARTEYRTICDLCAKDCTGFSNQCWLCRREVGVCCHKLLFVGKLKDVLDMPFKVCERCIEGHSEYVAAIQSALDAANREVRSHLDAWRESVKGE